MKAFIIGTAFTLTLTSFSSIAYGNTKTGNFPQNRELLAQSRSGNGQDTPSRGYSENPTTGGGYKGDWLHLNNPRASKNPTLGGGERGNGQNTPSRGYSENPTTGGGYRGDWLRVNNPNSSSLPSR